MSIETDTSPKVTGGPQHPNSWIFLNGEFRRYHDARIGIMTLSLIHI